MVNKSDVYFWLLISTVFLVGMIAGAILSYFLAIEGLKAVGDSFQIQSMNVTVQLNQTMLEEAMREAVNNSRMP